MAELEAAAVEEEAAELVEMPMDEQIARAVHSMLIVGRARPLNNFHFFID